MKIPQICEGFCLLPWLFLGIWVNHHCDRSSQACNNVARSGSADEVLLHRADAAQRGYLKMCRAARRETCNSHVQTIKDRSQYNREHDQGPEGSPDPEGQTKTSSSRCRKQFLSCALFSPGCRSRRRCTGLASSDVGARHRDMLRSPHGKQRRTP